MKKIVLLFLAPVALFLSSCGNSPKEEVSMEGMEEINLVILGDSLSIMVPDSLSGVLQITEQPWGATEVKIGESFQLSIEQSEGDIALQKSDIAGDDVYKFERYVIDEPTLLFWGSRIPDFPKTNYHFYMIQKVGKLSFLIKDIESGVAYSEHNIESMVKSGKTLKSIKSKDKEA